MDYKKWVWCLRCQRCFEVSLSREPREGHGRPESTFSFLSDFEGQFSKGQDGGTSVRCQYQNCDGDMMSFWWWEDYLDRHPEAPKTPTANTVYTLYNRARA